jgi:hypothetical protein
MVATSKSNDGKTVNEAAELRPLLAAEAVPLAPVDNEKWYKVTLQIGAGNRWREFCGGRWETTKTEEIDFGHGAPKQRKRHMQHIPALHVARRLDGETVNGLIGEHNLWLRENQACGPRPRMFDDDGVVNQQLLRGNISRQLLVVSVEQDEPPQAVEDSRRLAEIAIICRGVVTALVESGVLSPSATKGK